MHVFVKYTADNLNANGVHMFLLEGGLEKEFVIFDDSQKMATALDDWKQKAKPDTQWYTKKNGGHDWDWTSDPYDVNVVLSRWATRPTPFSIADH